MQLLPSFSNGTSASLSRRFLAGVPKLSGDLFCDLRATELDPLEGNPAQLLEGSCDCIARRQIPFASQSHNPGGSMAHWNEGRVLTNPWEPVLEEDTDAQTQKPRERRAFPSAEWLQRPSPIPMNTVQDHQQGEHTYHLQVRLDQPHHAQGSPMDANVSISFFRDPRRHLPTYSACLGANHSLFSTQVSAAKWREVGEQMFPRPPPHHGL